MRIIFVRHGEPDYERDCLTETGRRQAAACAERLAGEGISRIYASPLGRAAETASYTARRLGLPVETLDYMREASWGGEGVPCEGHPWTLADRMIAEENFDFHAGDWRAHPFWAKNTYLDSFALIAPRIDALVEAHGYRHDGGRFLCETDSPETFALFSHGGSGACALAHLLNLPLPWVVTVLPYDFTSIIILEFPVCKGEWVHPRIELFNDIAHIRGSGRGPVFQQKPDGGTKNNES